MITKIDHIGIAVRSIEEARRFYEEALGLVCEKIEEVASQQVRVAFFRVGEVHIELLEPMSDKSPLATFLASKGEGFHHIAYATEDIGGQLDSIRGQGLRIINEIPVKGSGGKEIAFLHPSAAFGVLIELVREGESESKEASIVLK